MMDNVTGKPPDDHKGKEAHIARSPPNPTSGYIEIVPLEDVVQTDWTMEEAMSFVMTGGANAPDRVRYASSPEKGAPENQEADAP